MFRKLWYWLNKVRFFDVYIPEWLYKRINQNALVEEARMRMQLMQEEIIRKRIINYYKTINSGKVDIPSFIQAEEEITRLKRSGDFQLLVTKALEDEVA